MRAVPAELTEFLAPFDDVVVEVALSLRDRVLTVMPNAHEVVWDATNAVSLVFTPTARWQDGICHMAVYTKHANLGFNDGASLDDPARLLEGTGTRIRHVSFRSVADTEAPWLDGYLRAAMQHASMASDAGDGGTTIRVSSGPRRRPTRG